MSHTELAHRAAERGAVVSVRDRQGVVEEGRVEQTLAGELVVDTGTRRIRMRDVDLEQVRRPRSVVPPIMGGVAGLLVGGVAGLAIAHSQAETVCPGDPNPIEGAGDCLARGPFRFVDNKADEVIGTVAGGVVGGVVGALLGRAVGAEHIYRDDGARIRPLAVARQGGAVAGLALSF